MKLFGSTTSPYVRRLRMRLENHAYDFVDVNVYDPAARQLFGEFSPVKKLPALQDESQAVYDSRMINSYLSEKFSEPALSVDEHNLMSIIDGVNDSGIILFMATRSKIDNKEDKLIFSIQWDRIKSALLWLDENAERFDEWNYLSICLLSLLDWLQFREVFDWRASGDYKALADVFDKHAQQAIFKSTDPRL